MEGERRAFLITKCSRVQPVMITPFGEWYIDGISIDPSDYDSLARAEGFSNFDELLAYIKEKYEMPFHGRLIHWPRPHYLAPSNGLNTDAARTQSQQMQSSAGG